MEMNQTKKKHIVIATRELIYIIIVILTIILGIASQLLSSSGHIIFNIANYDSISLSAIQIQGAIFGVTVALLALMSGRITESYLGIRYNDFLLNLKPKVFKQKTLIALSLILIVLNIWFHMMGWFSLVISIFIAACELIWISVDEIYEAFSGSERLEDEIKAYLWDHIDSSNEKKAINYLVDFCNEWKYIAVDQGNVDYNEYWDTFSKLFRCTFKTDRCRAQLLDQCTLLSKTMLCDAKSIERGLELFQWCYKQAWQCIADDRDYYAKQEQAFNLLNSTYEYYCKALDSTTIQILEDKIRWSYLIEIIILVNLCLAYNEKRPWKETELGIAEYLSGYFGRLIANKPGRSDAQWGDELTRLKPHVSLPNNLLAIFDDVLSSCKLRFMIAQIRSDPNNLVKKYLIENSRLYYDVSEFHALMLLRFHCYLWYVAFYENSSYIGQECIDRCKDFLYASETKSFFKEKIMDIGLHDKSMVPSGLRQYDLYNNRLEDRIMECLRIYEAFPMNGEVKQIIMDSAVEDYVVFLSLYLSRLFNRAEIIDTLTTGDRVAALYMKFIRDGNRRDKLKTYYELLNEDKNDVSDKVEASYSLLENRLRHLYKLESIKRAREVKTKEKVFGPKRKEKLAQDIQQFLQSQFSGLLSAEGKASFRLPLVSVNIFADMDIESFIHDNYEALFHNFTGLIANKLLKAGRLNLVEKTKFHDDNHYLKYLLSKNDCIVIGSEFRLSPFNYKNREKVKTFIESTEHYTNGANGCALIIKKDSLHFAIKEIRISARSQRLEEVEYKYDESTGLYCFNVSSGMPVMFEKHELKEYLDNIRRVYNIVVHIELSADEGIIGDLIVKQASNRA